MIRREVPGETDEGIEAAGYRAAACAYHYSGLRWIVSYRDRAAERLYCIYEAESVEQLVDHARRSLIPCDEVIEVDQILPESFAGNPDAKAVAGVETAS